MKPDIDFTFTAELWEYKGKGAWHFATLPPDESAQIKFFHPRKMGWGSVRVKVRIGNTEWTTSVFPDSKTGAYVLPVKADVRKKEKIVAGDNVKIKLEVLA